jgi:hypothetical protein
VLAPIGTEVDRTVLVSLVGFGQCGIAGAERPEREDAIEDAAALIEHQHLEEI